VKNVGMCRPQPAQPGRGVTGPLGVGRHGLGRSIQCWASQVIDNARDNTALGMRVTRAGQAVAASSEEELARVMGA